MNGTVCKTDLAEFESLVGLQFALVIKVMSDSAEKNARIQENARNIVDLLLEYGRIKHLEIPIKIQHPDGSVTDGVFTGYYPADMSLTGQPTPSVGYKTVTKDFSHGMLRNGDQIIGHIPSFIEWEQWVEQQQREAAAKKANEGHP